MTDSSLKQRLAGLFRSLNQPIPPSLSSDPPSPNPLQALFSNEQLIISNEQLTNEQLPTPYTHPIRTTNAEPATDQELNLQSLIQNPKSKIQNPDPVLTLLKSKDPAARRQAAQKLIREWGEWAIDPLLYAAADPDPETAHLALTSLAQIDETVTARVLALANEPANPLHQGAAAYLSHLAGQPLVYIPAGPFLMGSNPAADPLAQPAEQPQHRLNLSGCWLGRYPVTVACFHDFLAESRYLPRGERQFNSYSGQSSAASADDDYPVVDVAWDDALAYCDWLAGRTGLPISLPSEAEWEKAARGVDGRRYPWGNRPPTPELCNFHQPTPVGRYSPQGDSPYGCADMAGNVWEWSRSLERPYPYQPGDGREDLAAGGARIVRGLTFNNQERFTRCAFRHSLPPMLHLTTLGFRVGVIPGG